MPKVNSVTRLIYDIANKDYDAARRTISIMIDDERKGNKVNAARQLENALQRWPNMMTLTELPHHLKNFVWPDTNVKSLSEIYLDEDVNLALQKFIRERRHAEKLSEAGLSARKSILLGGPPGNGKTTLASALARELELPLISTKMHGLVESHLGESSRNIGKIFEYAMMNRCVLFIDEFDAIGTQRGHTGESAGKELNGIVTTLLTNIDRLPDSSVFVAATNIQDAIDPALQRRFDLKLWLDHPDQSRIAEYVAEYQVKQGIRFSRETPAMVADLIGKPWSVVEQMCLDLHKELILGELPDMEWIGKQASMVI